MTIVNMHEAKTKLSALVEKVQSGAEIVIAKAGKPVAKLVPFTEPVVPREPGGWEGEIWIADDFDAPLPDDLQRAFGAQEDGD